MRIAWYSRDGHLEIMARTAAQIGEQNGDYHHFFVCHNSVEAAQLKANHGIESVTTLGDDLPKFKPDGYPDPAELTSLSEEYSAVPLARVAWQDIFELGSGEPKTTQNLVAHIKFWEAFLTLNKITHLVAEVPSILSTCAAWLVCQTLNVHVLSPIDIAPLGDRMVISRSWQGYYSGFDEGESYRHLDDYGPVARDYAQQYLNQFTGKPSLTAEVQRRRAAGAYEGMTLSTFFSKLPGFIGRRRAKQAYYMRSGGGFFFHRWMRAAPNLAYHRLFSPLERHPESSLRRPYFLMPLHEPGEWSNYTWMGVRYADLRSLIREVSASIPPGFELLVKEHSSGFGLRPLKFYRSMKTIPRVRLIHPYADGFNLMRNSSGVVTLGSSMGWEAWLLDCPVILLGEPWYWRLPGIKRARNAEELALHLQNAIQGVEIATDIKLAVVAQLFSLSFEAVKHPHPNALSQDNVRRWAEAIRSELNAVG